MMLAHRPLCSAHPGSRKTYATLRRTYLWPAMSPDCHFFLENCQECACARVSLRKHAKHLVLLTASAPLESVAVDLLDPFLKTPRNNTYILAITDRYSKLTRVVALAKINAYTVAEALVNIAYSQMASLLQCLRTVDLRFLANLSGCMHSSRNSKRVHDHLQPESKQPSRNV